MSSAQLKLVTDWNARDVPLGSDIPLVETELDSLHILPLSIIPLRTGGMRKARLIKNARLEGVIEVFSGPGIGSGQISPSSLHDVFQRRECNSQDFMIVEKLGALASYDTYSLRIQLRQMGLKVDDHVSLRLSDQKTRELTAYMAVFTRPLMTAIYGSAIKEIDKSSDLRKVFTDPDQKHAKENLFKLANKLNLSIMEIPNFLADYGDVYLSLAYYQNCFDELANDIKDFLITLSDLKKHQILRQNEDFIKDCDLIENKINTLISEMTTVLEMFESRTFDMWNDLSSVNFLKMKDMILGYQTSFGGALCAIAVKMAAWSEEFPKKQAVAPIRYADFIRSQMRPGIETIPNIHYVKVR